MMRKNQLMISLAALAFFGCTLLSSCEKDDDENDLTEQEYEVDEETKNAKG